MYTTTEPTTFTAPSIDRLVRIFDRRGLPDVTKPSDELACAVDALSGALSRLAPLPGNAEAKSIWVRVPRGGIDDYGDFEDAREYDEDIETRDDFAARWLEDYPDPASWYELTVVESGTYRGVSVNDCAVVCCDTGPAVAPAGYLDGPRAELVRHLARAAGESMRLLEDGAYNGLVASELPYWHRYGVVRRRAVWDARPDEREATLEGLAPAVFAELKRLVGGGASSPSAVSRLRGMTGNDFLRACRTGYAACGYELDGADGEPLSLVDLYLRHADGRDEGLTGRGSGLHAGGGIDLDSPEAFEEWYFDRDRHGGHPFEVCRGGNSTHVDLFVRHDRSALRYRHALGELTDGEYEEGLAEAGFYYEVAGKSWTRAAEAASFYVALSAQGLPVVLSSADAILARFEAADLVGIVPRDVIPAYCESRFPEELGTILDFRRVYDEDMAAYGDAIEWLPVEEAKLL